MSLSVVSCPWSVVVCYWSSFAPTTDNGPLTTDQNSASRLPAAGRAALAAEAVGIARHPGCWPVHAPRVRPAVFRFGLRRPFPPAKPPRAVPAFSQSKTPQRRLSFQDKPAANGRAGLRSAVVKPRSQIVCPCGLELRVGFEPTTVRLMPDALPLSYRSSTDRASDAVHGTHAGKSFDAACAASVPGQRSLKAKKKSPGESFSGAWTFHNRMNRLPRRARAGGALMKATNIPRGRAHDRQFPGYKRARDRWPPFGFAIRC